MHSKKNKKIALLLIISISVPFSALAFFGTKSPGKTQVKDLWIERSDTEKNGTKINIPSFSPLIKRAEPAVLVVSTESVQKVEQPRLPQELERGPFKDFFKFFGPPNGQQQERKRRGQGSGFIIHPSGYALTNHHVVGGSKDGTKITVKVGTSLKEYVAEVIGSDEATDVALIKIQSDRKDWPVIPLGDSAKSQVGDFAVAIGNPLGLELSASHGMISARGRHNINPSGKNGLYDFIQIDAPINPGNSSGPLLNLFGEAIGINTAISVAGQGIAFAIPMNQIKQILPALKSKGKATRSWLGVRISSVNSELAKDLGLKFPHGALISEVVADSPASKAGIQPGDVITKFNDKLIKDASSLQVFAGLAGVSKEIDLTLIRDKKKIHTLLKLEAMPGEKKPDEQLSEDSKEPEQSSEELKALGLTISDLSDKAREELDLGEKTKGVLVSQVAQRSPAAFSGMEANDVILKLNGKKTKKAKDFIKMIEKTPEGGYLRVLLKRGPSTIFLVLQKPKMSQTPQQPKKNNLRH